MGTLSKRERTSGKCIICGWDRITDRCHLIPRRVLATLRGGKNYVKMTSVKNTISLCKNHHFLFDTFRLNDAEWKIVLDEFKIKMWGLLLEMLNSDLKTIKRRKDIGFKKRNNAFESWKKRMSIVLLKYKYLFYYGEDKELLEMQQTKIGM